MSEPRTGVVGLRVSAALVLVGAVLSGPVAMLVVSATAPQPTWAVYAALVFTNYLLIAISDRGGFVASPPHL